jgi:hypothetical protein
MILVEDRRTIVERIIQAQRKGARLKAACEPVRVKAVAA